MPRLKAAVKLRQGHKKFRVARLEHQVAELRQKAAAWGPRPVSALPAVGKLSDDLDDLLVAAGFSLRKERPDWYSATKRNLKVAATNRLV